MEKTIKGFKIKALGQDQIDWVPPIGESKYSLGFFKYFKDSDVRSPFYQVVGEQLHDLTNQYGGESWWEKSVNGVMGTEDEKYEIKINFWNSPGNSIIKLITRRIK